MFESVKQERRGAKTYLTSLLISLGVHAAIFTVAVVLPLVFFRVIGTETVLAYVLQAPGLPQVHEPPVPPPVAAPAEPRLQTVVARPSGDFVEPVEIPGSIPPPDDALIPAGMIGMTPGITGVSLPRVAFGPPAETGKGLMSLLERPTEIPLPPPPPVERRREVIRIGRLEPSRLTRMVSPIYPEIAIRARVSGTVTLEAVIDEEGNITALKVISGHLLLRKAAADAVRQWKYIPTIQNGEPVPVVTTIEVTFRLVK